MPSPSWCRDRGRAEAAPLPEAPAANGLLPPRSVESESDQPLVAPLLWLLMVEGRWRPCAWRYGPPPFGLRSRMPFVPVASSRHSSGAPLAKPSIHRHTWLMVFRASPIDGLRRQSGSDVE